MRDRIIDELGALAHPRFLVYLMGPYEAFDIETMLESIEPTADDTDLSAIPEQMDFGTLVNSDAEVGRETATLDLLLSVRDRLRTEPGVNAFLAIDIDISLEEMDAASQSIEFAFASNAIVYLVPQIGDNLGVGIEVGSVLEAIFREQGTTESPTRHERVAFVHESGVRSAMIAAVRDRWDARIYSYTDCTDLIDQVRLFVRDIARREMQGNLPTLDDQS